MKTPHLMCLALGQVPALGADSFTTMPLSSVVFLVVYINYTDAVIPLALPVQLLLNSLNTDSIPAIHISARILRATCGSPWLCRFNTIKKNTVELQQGIKMKQKPQQKLREISESLGKAAGQKKTPHNKKAAAGYISQPWGKTGKTPA